MKAKLLTAGIVVLIASTAHAAVFVSDNFDAYSTGNLVGQGSWAATAAAGNPVQVITAPAGLTGNAARLNQITASEDVYKPLGATMAAGDKWYVGFDVVVTGSTPVAGANGASDYFAHFKNVANVFPTKLGVAEFAGSDFTFSVHQGSGSSNPPSGSGQTSLWSTGFAFGTVHRLVASYEYSTGLGELWVDPVAGLGAAGNVKIQALNATSANAVVVQYGLRQGGSVVGNSSTQAVDNLLVGTSWAEVVPEPSMLSLLTLGAFGLLRRRR